MTMCALCVLLFTFLCCGNVSARMGQLRQMYPGFTNVYRSEGYPLGYYQQALRLHDRWMTTHGDALVVAGRRVKQSESSAPENVVHRRSKRKAIRHQHMRWPYATVPYTFEESFSDSDKDIVHQAMRRWEEHTCLKFVAKDNPQENIITTNNYIHFVKSGGCWSKVGMFWWTPEQKLSLDNECLQNKNGVAIAMHEIGHAIGFFHEHARPDRDDHVTIEWDNIRWGRYRHFSKFYWNMIETYDIPYDYLSIMHYSDNEFSWDRKTRLTIRTHDPSYQDIIGQRISLSYYDIKMTNDMYSCAARCPYYLRCDYPNSFLGPSCRCLCPNYHGLGAKECPQNNAIQMVHGYGGHYLDCYENTGTTYRGTRSWTRSGHTCMNWAHTLDRDVSTLTYPNSAGGIGNHNYCRNPYAGSPQPWCYVSDIRVFWEYCDIPRCP
ncbi:blastula protease 10-like isoform X1 [Branchiostoma floridae x Branchiostoma japonicum]